MRTQQFSTSSAVSLGVAATIPAFLILSLNGTSLFYGLDTVAILSAGVGFAGFLAGMFSRKLK
ncbi:hypothetical protein [Limnobacter parvus]|uniref:Uncharacterized protein n=1 Tax=Limnobacter parvus TaxID=2939690 RepID=A0ABT1XE70_9BURK|nr:hypothetical protein [Limnobacter parvus]MCR2745573.1 hypothetical protein [Limnobacter parvus]